MAHKGTIEHYRYIFMNDGIREMITAITETMKEAGNAVTPERLDGWIKAILYGYDKDGTVRPRPPSPDMFDLGKGIEGQDRYKFESMVYRLWVNKRNR